MNKTNYHTHTYRCKHALGSDEDYVKQALTAGFTIWGFSDHTPWPLHPIETSYYRMETEELPGYLKSINNLKVKYQNQIKIYIGLEAEYFPDRLDWLKKLKEQYLDYLVFGNHYHHFTNLYHYYGQYDAPKAQLIDDYLSDTYDGLSSGLYDIYGHPDLFLANYQTPDKSALAALAKITEYSRQFNIPLEYNLAGLSIYRNYPSEQLFRLAAKNDAPVIVNGDYHNPQAINDKGLYLAKRQMLEEWGCRVVETIPLDDKEKGSRKP